MKIREGFIGQRLAERRPEVERLARRLGDRTADLAALAGRRAGRRVQILVAVNLLEDRQ
jgi:hypothetical protein